MSYNNDNIPDLQRNILIIIIGLSHFVRRLLKLLPLQIARKTEPSTQKEVQIGWSLKSD